MRRRHILKKKIFGKKFATKFCTLSQNFMSIVFLVLKLWQNIVQGWGDTLQTAQSVNANQKKKKKKKKIALIT